MQETNDSQPQTITDFAVWQAIYADGRVIHQKDWYNKELPPEDRPSYEELDRDQLVQFQMITPDDRLIFAINFKPGTAGRLIWRRRVQIVPGRGAVHIYVVGKRGAFIAAIMPDYTIILDDNFNEDNVMLGNVDPVKGEDNYEEK